MNELGWKSNELDKTRLLYKDFLEEFGCKPESLQQIIADILAGSPLSSDLPECPDVSKEFAFTSILWIKKKKELEFKKFVSLLNVVIQFHDPEKAKQFDEYITALDRKYDIQSIIDEFTRDQNLPPNAV